jgi:hypothetical protein
VSSGGGINLIGKEVTPISTPARWHCYIGSSAPGHRPEGGVLCKQASASRREKRPWVLVLDDRGRVVQHTEAAERWLSDLHDLGDGWLEGEGPAGPGVDGCRRSAQGAQARD